MRTNLLLGTAAVGVLITGAVAQTSSGIERIKDAAGYSKSLSSSGEAPKGSAAQTHESATSQQPAQPKKTVRTVYPNTQNAEQAVQQSKTAQAAADASKSQPGDVTPLSTTEPSAAQANPQPSTPAKAPQPTAQVPSTAQGTAASSAPQSAAASSTQPSAPAPTTRAAQPTAPATTTQSVQSTPSAPVATAPAATTQLTAPTATAQESHTPSEPSRQSSNGVVALDTQQQTSMGQAIASHKVKPLTNVTFSMAIGTKVPGSVQLRALPSDVATFVPQYRGYSYFVVEEQMVIVDPGTQAIVAIVPYTASAVASNPVEVAPAAQTSEKRTTKFHEASTRKHPRPIAQKPMVIRSVNLNTEERSATRRASTERKATRTVSKRDYRERDPAAREYREPERVAPTVTIEDYPQPVYREMPRRRGFFGLFGGGSDDDDY